METFLIISNILMWVCMIMLVAGFFYLSRMVGEFLSRFRVSEGKVDPISLQIGQQAPYFRALDHRGELIRLSPDQEHKGVTVLMFKNSACGTCASILGHLQQGLMLDPQVRLILVDNGSNKEGDLTLPDGVHLVHSPDVFQSYFIDQVPEMFAVGANGTILKRGRVQNFEHLQQELTNLHSPIISSRLAT